MDPVGRLERTGTRNVERRPKAYRVFQNECPSMGLALLRRAADCAGRADGHPEMVLAYQDRWPMGIPDSLTSHLTLRRPRMTCIHQLGPSKATARLAADDICVQDAAWTIATTCDECLPALSRDSEDWPACLAALPLLPLSTQLHHGQFRRDATRTIYPHGLHKHSSRTAKTFLSPSAVQLCKAEGDVSSPRVDG